MIVDHRVYTLKPNRLKDFLNLYEEHGLPLQRKYLGEPVGFYATEIGRLNRIIHLWQYEDLADRERRRAAMEADPAWSAYRQMVIEADCLLDMQNEIVRPVPFFKSQAAGRS